MPFEHTDRLTCVFGTASLVATVVPLLLAIVALVPPLLTGSIDGVTGHRMWLYDAYLFCALSAPAVGAATLAVTVFANHAATPATRGALTRSRRLAAVALASSLLWVFLFPFVFFATGGTR